MVTNELVYRDLVVSDLDMLYAVAHSPVASVDSVDDYIRNTARVRLEFNDVTSYELHLDAVHLIGADD